jgi:NAD-dependent deacetylase
LRSDGPAKAVAAAATVLARSEHAVVLTGAGISVESGIPVFRGENGLWTKHGPPRPDSYQRFLQDPSSWWRGEISRSLEPWVVELREAARRARPNAGHEALAGLEKSGVLRTVITQNLDGLHQAAGSSNVVEIHGSRFKLRCVDCGRRTPREELFARRAPPPCEQCGGRVKHDSVLFGEPIPPDALAAAREAADQADCMLVVGTSSTVRPAGGLPRIAKANGATLIEVNPLETALSGACDVVIRAPAGEALPLLATVCASKPVGTAGPA